MGDRVTITVSGPVGSGKSALCKEIEILCRALGVPCHWEGGQQERNLSGGDSYDELAMYQPSVVLREGGVLPVASDEIAVEQSKPLRFWINAPLVRETMLIQAGPAYYEREQAEANNPPTAGGKRRTIQVQELRPLTKDQ